MRVVAAIPNYNMGPHAVKLAEQLLTQKYDHVYILDDKSNDGSEKLAEKLKENKRFTFVAGLKNIGAGPNRNRVLEYEQKGIVHFIDADVMPAGKDNVESITKAFKRHSDAAIIGLRVRNPDGSQYGYNFGPIFSLPKDAFTTWSWRLHKHVPLPPLKKIYGKRWATFWTYMHPEDADNEQQVGAVVECNMAVKLEDFAGVGAFADNLRFHEIIHLVEKLKTVGKTVWYIPEGLGLKYDHGDVRAHRHVEYTVSMARVFKNQKLGRYKK